MNEANVPRFPRRSAHPAAIVKFAYSDGKGERTVRFTVAENLLWYAEGLRYLFNCCRESYLVAPESGGNQEAWESWHLAAVEYSDDIGHIIPFLDALPPFEVPA